MDEGSSLSAPLIVARDPEGQLRAHRLAAVAGARLLVSSSSSPGAAARAEHAEGRAPRGDLHAANGLLAVDRERVDSVAPHPSAQRVPTPAAEQLERGRGLRRERGQ